MYCTTPNVPGPPTSTFNFRLNAAFAIRTSSKTFHEKMALSHTTSKSFRFMVDFSFMYVTCAS